MRTSRIVIFLLALIPLGFQAQLVVDNSVTATVAVQDFLLGEGVIATNVTMSGDGNQIGSFDGANSNVGMDSGIILATGNCTVAQGPNNSGSSSSGGGNFGVSDPDIQALNPSNSFNDCVVLEFDFVATGDSVSFNYVFASEEYPEYANSSFNDTFGFFLSGPGISGPYSNNSINIAQIPGTSLPVSINNLNNGTTGTGGPCEYCEYYIHNGTGFQSPMNTDNTYIQFDGFTTVLKAEGEVQCGETYHIKIAIADAGDTSFDSAVFLEAGSFTSNQIEIDLQIADISANDSTLYEGCGSANIVFTRPPGSVVEQTFYIEVTGTATNGVDFTLLPDSLTFGAGETEIIFPFETFEDFVTEGMEQVTISFVNVQLCGQQGETDSYNLYIAEAEPISLTFAEPTIDCGETVTLNVTASGGYGYYNAEWEDGTEGFSLDVSPNGTTQYLITVSDTCSVQTVDSLVTVTIPDYPDIEVDLGADQELDCLDNLIVIPNVEGGFGGFTYSWAVNGSNVSTETALDYLTDDDGTVVLTITDECGATGQGSMEFVFPPVEILVDLGADVSATCIEWVQLDAIVSGGIGNYSYSWMINGVEYATTTTYTLQVPDDETVTLVVTDQCENESSDQVEVLIPPVPVNVNLGPDLEVDCLDITNLSGTTTGGVGGYTYEWFVDGESVGQSPNYQIQVDGTTTVVLESTDQCGNVNSDELILTTPPVPISVDLGPDLMVICTDVSYLEPVVSGGVGDYSYYWQMEGIYMGDQSWTEVQTSVDAEITVIIEDECGNTAGDELLFTIPEIPINITFSDDSVMCAGVPVDIQAFAEGGLGELSYFWYPTEQSGSTIIVEPEETSAYSVLVTDECGNSATSTTIINVEVVIADFDFDYLDEWSVELFNNSEGAIVYFWDLGDGNSSDEENPSFSYLDNDEHEIILYAIGEYGCVDSLAHTFYPLMDVFVPSAFTPNNDGINDLFKVEGHDIVTFEIRIFNRWGELVYQSYNLDDVWDGSHIGGEYFVPDGTYGYYVKATGVRLDGYEKSGSITVYR
ncbi:MAG: choice-of-anchor L domain-containing protein [Flavobacteriales bacterium]|nr:choice-of-anchor L domain-containing protein [Flavobacteriales bacterium]